MKQLLLISPNASNPEYNLAEFFEITSRLDCDKFLFYDSVIPDKDLLKGNNCKLFPQLGTDKTEIVMNAFLKAFLKDYKKVIWIDLNHLIFSKHLLQRSFLSLEEEEVVFASGHEGKISLLGMKNFYSQLFEGEMTEMQVVTALRSNEISYIKTFDPAFEYFSPS